MPTLITNLTDFESMVKDTPKAVVDFSAIWCGPCKMIEPHYQQMESEFPEIQFFKVDLDVSPDIAEKCEIVGVPTFRFFVQGYLFGDFSGANVVMLRNSLIDLNEYQSEVL